MAHRMTAAKLGTLALLIAMPHASPAAPIVQARRAEIPGCSQADVLRTDAVLEERAPRIRAIEFAIGDVFERENGGALRRAANRLHSDTRESTLRARLLFAPGEVYRRRVLEESERSLRGLRFLYDAQVEPVRYDAAANEVDVRVCTRDVWTLSPSASFARSGGENASSVELDDQNIFGSGHRVKVARSENVDRSGTLLSWEAPNVFAARWQASAEYQSNSDGGLRAFSVTRPFLSLETQHAFGAAFADTRSTQRLYGAGEPVVEFAAAERTFEVWTGLSHGLDAGWTRRYLAGWTVTDEHFASASAVGAGIAASAPPDVRLSYPWVGLQWIEDRFAQTRDLDQIGRTEDVHLGLVADARAGLTTPAFGGDREALLLSGSAAWAHLWRADRLLSLHGSLSTRVEPGGARNSDFRLGARGYRRWSHRWMSFAALESRVTHDLDPHLQVLLGGDNGLRGYPLRFQNGTASALATLEQRLFTSWEPFGLVRVGGAAFFDAGRTWGAGAGTEGGRWLNDVGIGLRLGNTRSSRGNVIHVDLAVPLNAAGRVNGLQVLVETKASF
jgi:hypothetical protein